MDESKRGKEDIRRKWCEGSLDLMEWRNLRGEMRTSRGNGVKEAKRGWKGGI